MSRHRTASTAAHRTATLVAFAPRTIPASIPLNDVSELWAVRDAAEREQNKAGESPPDIGGWPARILRSTGNSPYPLSKPDDADRAFIASVANPSAKLGLIRRWIVGTIKNRPDRA